LGCECAGFFKNMNAIARHNVASNVPPGERVSPHALGFWK
jgi:hypothetical protein